MLVIETAPRFLPEKQYAFDVLLGEILGLPFRIQPVEGRSDYQIVLPNGKKLVLEDHFFDALEEGRYLHSDNFPESSHRIANPLLPGEFIAPMYGRVYFDDHRCGLDLVASAFFMLTRWEEYVRPERDRHGRFPAGAAYAVRMGFIRQPVVDEYAALLGHMLLRLDYSWTPTHARFKMNLSHDVDHPKRWWKPADRRRTLAGSLLRRFNPAETIFWLKNGAQDPFDTFDWLMDLSEKNGLVSQFNFLGERARNSDCWYPLHDPFVLDLMKKIARRGHVIGFHPSYEAFADEEKFRSELASLRAVSPLPVSSGRQHYLRFSVPRTWQMWAGAGLLVDSSLGYPEMPGFRCGICREFPVFDFLQRKTLPLREKPLIAMDVSLAQYQKNTPEEALRILNSLRHEVRKHQGEFTLLWHNSSLNDYFWRPWRTVYESFVSS